MVPAEADTCLGSFFLRHGRHTLWICDGYPASEKLEIRRKGIFIAFLQVSKLAYCKKLERNYTGGNTHFNAN